MFNILTFEELDSTNKYAKENISSLNNFDVIFAKKQTNGRGRMDRKWISSSSSLTFSIILKDEFATSNFDAISLLTASSVFMALSNYLKDKLSIKWPNDIYYKDSKICGILLEGISYSSTLEAIVVGIGVNVNNTIEELEMVNATSICNVTTTKCDTKQVLKEILNSFESLYNNLKNGNRKYYDIIKENNYLKNKTAFAQINNESKEVKIIDILENNKLLVNCCGVLKEISTGEISFHKE